MSSWYPSIRIVTTSEIEDRCIKEGFSHTSSHQLDPLPTAAVLAVIKAIKDEKLVHADHQKASTLKNV